MAIKHVLWGFLIGSIFTGCILGTQQLPWTELDSWYNPFPEYPTGKHWENLDQTYIHPVSDEQQAEAENRLQQGSCVELTYPEAKTLVGRELPEIAGRQPYLVRAVYLNQPIGKFVVYAYQAVVVIYHVSLGSEPVPMERQALVLQLQEKPERVFMDCIADKE